jgi:hypothetical protein
VGSSYGTLYAADLDGDGDVDVLMGSENADKVSLYENLGGGRFRDVTVNHLVRRLRPVVGGRKVAVFELRRHGDAGATAGDDARDCRQARRAAARQVALEHDGRGRRTAPAQGALTARRSRSRAAGRRGT